MLRPKGMSRPRLSQRLCDAGSPRTLGLAFTILLHLGLLAWMLWPNHPPLALPASLQPLQVDLLAPPPRSAPSTALPFAPPTPATLAATTRRLPTRVLAPPADPEPVAAPAPPAPAGAPGAVAGTALDPAPRRQGSARADCLPYSWLLQMSRRIGATVRVPLPSRGGRERGIAYVRVSVARDGRVLEAPLLRSSGHRNLDFEASDVMRRIARFAPVPASECTGYDIIVIDQPVSFAGG